MFVWPLTLFAATATATACGAETYPSDAGSLAASDFRDTCLKARGAGADAAVSAILAKPFAKEGASLPGYGGDRPKASRMFESDRVEYLVRYGKKTEYGCFVALPANPDLLESARGTLSGFEGLIEKPAKRREFEKPEYEWTFAGSKDEVRLSFDPKLETMLIGIEVY